jgi:branched-chain amino acid transport system substrate-binding protein
MSLTRKKFLIDSAAAGAAVSTAFAFPNIVLAKGEPIRLGVIPPITGSNALLGQQGREGAEFAVAQINARKGKVYDDRPLEIVLEDATSDNQTAVAAMNKLVTENVDVIVLPVLSTQIQAMAPVVKPTGIPWLTGGTAVKNTQLGLNNLFRFRASDAITASAIVNFLVKELKKQKIAILHSSEAFGVGGAQQCENTLTKLGLTSVLDIAYPIGQKDFTPEFLRIKQAGADGVILYVQNPSDTAIILGSYKQQNLGIPLVGSPSLANEGALEAAKDNANGCYGALDYIIGTPRTNDFITAFEAQFHEKPDVGTGSGWVVDAVTLYADTARKIGSTDKAKIIDALHDVKGWEGILGTHTCDPDGNMIHEVGIVQIVDEKPKLVKKVEG